MVAKISIGGNMFGALAYNQNKVDSEEAKVLFSNRMLLSEDGHFSIGECMRSFEMQMPVQLSTKKPILHISINPHPEDVLSDSQLSDIAREYMRKLGYGDQPYLVYKHEDIDRHHIHIVGLRVDENGRPLNDKFEHRRSKQITRELERKYNLHPAERKERAERPELKKVDYTAGDVKYQIGNAVKAACYGYRFHTLRQTAKAMAATGDVRDAKQTINAIIEDTWLEYTGDVNNILMMDAGAEAVSLTDSRNPAPSSVQILIRTQEIKAEELTAQPLAADAPEQTTFWGRVAQMFQDFWQAVTRIFRGKGN